MVNNLAGVRAAHLGLVGPATVRKLVTMMEKAWPVRPKVSTPDT